MSTSDYKPTIGLEVHAELSTETKMFCNSKNDPDETRPNVNVCPVCMGHPGTLPVINREAVRQVLRIGCAVGGEIADFTEFDRKNYFYPDIPKGYQISQYEYPLVSGGVLAGVALTRIHLEEDTATSKHAGDHSLVDFNRAGIPLMELVTEPVITSAQQASAFARELQLLLRYLGAGAANLEKGEMRIEANISVAPAAEIFASADERGPDADRRGKLGTKVEVKNLNSFKSVEGAIAYEIDRQISVLESGEAVVQETRGWDQEKEETFSQRKKETSEDYRYFPDPDLPKLKISEIGEFAKETLVETLPELPWERREKLENFGITAEDVEMYVRDPVFGDFIESVADELAEDEDLVRLASNYLASDVAGLYNKRNEGEIGIDPRHFADLIRMADDDEISSRGAKDIIEIMMEEGSDDPQTIAEAHNLLQTSSEDELRPIVQEIVAENADVVADYRGGKESAIQFLVGQGMRKTGGSANPSVLKELLREEISEKSLPAQAGE